MRRLVIAFLILVAFGFAASTASAGPVLYEAAFNQNGTVYTGGSKPANWTLALDGDGLGTITAVVSAPGWHDLLVFLDYEIDEFVNTYYNEYGATSAALPGAGLTWEIDEPGFVFGDIYDNFLAGALDGTNAVPFALPDDVSFALHRRFFLDSGEVATVKFATKTTPPASGFYLVQNDLKSPSSVYFSSDLDINGGGTTVPDAGSTLLLLGMGLAACSRLRRRG